MKTEITEENGSFSYTISFTSIDKLEDAIALLDSTTKKVEKYAAIKLSLYKDQVASIKQVASKSEYIDKVRRDLKINDDFDTVDFKIDGDKNSNGSILYIFFPTDYLSKLPNDVESLLMHWDNVFSEFNEIAVIGDNKENKTSLPHVQKDIDVKIINSLEFKKALNYTPEDSFEMSKSLDTSKELSNHFKKLTVFYCLKLLSSRTTDGEETQFVFDGYDAAHYNLPNESEVLAIHDHIFIIYEWVFADNSFADKLGLTRNLISIKNTSCYEHTFNNKLVKSLFSNYQIYLKDNLKQYIEVKNKISEFIFTLSNKCTDIYDSYISNSRNAVLAIFSYFFTVIIIKSYAKKSGLPLFTLDITILSIAFIIAAIYYIEMVWNETQKKSDNIKSRMNETKKMYENVLDKQDLDEIFDIESLNSLIELNKEANYHEKVKNLLKLIGAIVLALYIFNISNIAFQIDWSLFWSHACNII